MTTLDSLLSEFRSVESADRRGPKFAAVAYEIERIARKTGVTTHQMFTWLGAPDLFFQTDAGADYVYRFDHYEAGKNRDEWYFNFEKERLKNSGFNHAGINQLAHMRPKAEFKEPS